MSIQLKLEQGLVDAFAALTGDYSSIHMNPAFARLTQFRAPIVHGLLPVACLLMLRPLASSGVLRQISCRFLQAARVGDALELRADTVHEGSQQTISFSILRSDGAVLLTSGKAVFDSSLQPCHRAQDMAEGGAFFADRIDEMAWTAGQLEVGHEERLVCQPRMDHMRGFLDRVQACVGMPREMPAATPEAARDANLASALLASTLIGMRLPGRFATFLELDATFLSALSDGAVELAGSVVKLSPAGNRLQLALQWRQGGQVCAEGKASSLIGEDGPQGISCAAIQAQHAGLMLSGKVAVVTGASRGIGEATAKLLAMHGARVVVHYFRGEDDAKRIVADIRNAGGEAVALAADIRDELEVARLFDETLQVLGPVDILVNNAVGDFSPKPLDALGSKDFLDELTVTLFGVHACCKQVLPHMKAQRRGKIINLGSVATELPVPSQGKYITAKSALVGYTRSLAAEVAAHNIQVNLVVPAMTRTSLIAAVPNALRERLAEETPGGALLEPIDVAKTIAFLASDWSSPISGQQIVLNQGAAPYL